jgi:hypothetical protein
MSYQLRRVQLWWLGMLGKCRQIRQRVLRVARMVLLDVEVEDESIDGEGVDGRTCLCWPVQSPILTASAGTVFVALRCSSLRRQTQ